MSLLTWKEVLPTQWRGCLVIAFPKLEWPKARGEGVLTEEVRRAAVELALRTSNKNAARVYGVAPSTIGNWMKAAGHSVEMGRKPNALAEGWARAGLQVIGRAEYRPLPYRPKLTAAQIAQRGNHKKRLLRAQRRAEKLEEVTNG